MCWEYAPGLGEAMKDWIVDNVKLGLLTIQIMAKHENIHLTRTPLKNHGFIIMYPLGFW
jgi:hypothetical protein